MYLKRLEIQGFKSFANRTVLDFLAPIDGRHSITAVVGPNGSGKSNITDAIRWVMGETSLKMIRGKKSEDVIFGGSESKGKLGAAEVIMTLDNADGSVDFDYPELIITRRLYRTGESEYLINNSNVRLLDVKLLMAKAQFAEHAYSIVSQGMIDKLLIVGPQERKEFLDEASGIKEFQIKQHQAVLKLNRSKDNIEQAERLVQEVEPRLKLLSRQVKKLEKRQEVEIKLRESQEKYYTTLHSKNKKEFDLLDLMLLDAEKNYSKHFGNLENIQNQLATLAKSASRQEVFVELENKYQTLQREKNNFQREIVILEGKMHTEYSAKGKSNIGWLQKRMTDLKSSLENTNNSLSKVKEVKDRAQRESSKAQKEVEDLQSDLTVNNLKLSRLENELSEGKTEQNYFQSAGLNAVRVVMENKEYLGGKVFGVLAELAEVKEEHALALDVSAGSRVSSIVVEDQDVAKRSIELLRDKRAGIASFLPLNKIQERYNNNLDKYLGHSGVVGKAVDLVNYSPKFNNIFSFVFGDTLVVENLQVAKEVGIGNCRMVTLEGDLVEKFGVMKGGFRNRNKGLSFSGVSYKSEVRTKEIEAEIKNLKNYLQEKNKKQEQIKDSITDFQIEIKSAQNKIELLDSEKESVEVESSSMEKELQLLQVSPEEYGDLIKRMDGDKKELEERSKDNQENLDKVSKQIERYNQDEEDKKQQVFSLQEEMQKTQTMVNECVTERNELKIKLARLETKQEDLELEVSSDMNVSLQSILDRGPEILGTEDIEHLAGDIQKFKYQLSLIGGIDEEVEDEYKETKERYEFLTGQIDDLSKAIRDLEEMIGELDSIMKKKRAVAFKKIKKEFNRYFQILFDGGKADLQEIYEEEKDEEDEEDEEEILKQVQDDSEEPTFAEATAGEGKPKHKKKYLYGIDVIAIPPGKKIKHLNALSGGERTLASIALICAVLNYNPSPFVVLDEVEAALDEANTNRFAKIIAELSTKSQFIVITHNRVTMHFANALYGVSMSGDGVSKLLSVKLE